MKVALIGYGKMGHMIEEIARSRGHEIVSIIDVDNIGDFESDAFKSADVAIEFSMPSSAYDNVKKAFAAGVKVVSGTTAWFPQHREEMQDLCAGGNTLFWSSNFSIGVYLFSAVNSYLARLMNNFPGYDVAMDEVHHCHKLDAPSGTAITLAEGILSQLGRKNGWANELAPLGENESFKQPAPGEDLMIYSYRHDEVPGIHTVRYESDADRIVITHDAKSRKGFALGAVMAAEYAAGHSGLLGMDDLFKNLI
ncbi:MAG: 4-hydroxy-tetrahydrodipicolinate reductase [Bacteroidia bacterium]|nr:4-hydroxy-tetrahydrodipicolinate reductase [Bacteroidia bacterium]